MVAAEVVGLDIDWDVAPVGTGVQVDVQGCFARGGNPITQVGSFVGCAGAFDYPALPGHDGITGPEMSPTIRHREIVAGHIATVDGGRHRKGGNFRAQGTFGLSAAPTAFSRLASGP